ncbi:MAG TPA: hypothetical protein VFD36_20645 [Kofleriaceae bacterium]|nr:hypothetical protein [Kofleriaceae bacterium]
MRPAGCPPRGIRNGKPCDCVCHRVPGVVHVMACCTPRIRLGLGADDVEADTVVLRRVDKNVAQLVAAQQAEERRRQLGLILTGAGVLFAAVKLGFIAVPHVLRWKRGQ